MPSLSATHNQPEYSVSEISAALKRVVEDTFGRVRVRGEISGFKRAASGHLYMDLKDDKAVLNAVCWKGMAARLGFAPEDGLEVICTGKLSTYPGRSNYQLIIDSMEPAGVGALMALLEKRKKTLAAEGLFDAERKQPLPYLPRVIGVVTSPTGAVIRDILHRLGERFPLHVLVWPVLVQGEGAAEQITTAIDGFNAMNEAQRPDLLIVARGGGSLEDLWAFNEENTVRAAARSAIPLISAVGHETDTTLIDYVSDRRAPTPSAAAEMAVPVRRDLLAWVMEQQARLLRLLTGQLQQRCERLEGLERGLPRPATLLAQQQQRLDDWSERLGGTLPLLLERKQKKLELAGAGLSPVLLMQQIRHTSEQLTKSHHRIRQWLEHRMSLYESQLEGTVRILENLNYQNVLKRGYVLVRDSKRKPVTQAAQAAGISQLRLQFQDGEMEVQPAERQGSLL